MKRWPDRRAARQFRLATLLLVVLAFAFLLANIVPRYSTAGSTPGFLVEHWHRCQWNALVVAAGPTNAKLDSHEVLP